MEQTAVSQKEKTGINKTAIKNFAIYSRNKLMNDIKNKAALIGITESGIQKPLSTSTGNVQFFDIGMTNPYQIEGKAMNQRNELIRELDRRTQGSTYKTAYETLIEEVAYTWFNRIIAIRFMEVNNYMPNRLRVLSSGVSGINEPEIITHVFESGLEFTQKEQDWIIEQKSNGSNIAMDELFQFLFIKQCNELNKNLPELFEKTNDYTELLLTVSYNDLEGVVYKLIHEVLEADFDVTMHGQIEILGWLYQYYNSDRKDEVINAIGKKVIKKQDIPAATQLFTTDWVVKYMVDNSLGKYWMERNSQSDLINSLEFLVTKEIGKVDEKISPEDIRFLDDCMGSGHILVYAFEVLMRIYEDEGYTSRETAKLIIEKNIYGLEIDKRSYQLSYFAIMMKARQYNRRILEEEVSHNLYLFKDSTSIDPNHINFLGKQLPETKREKAELQINYLLKEFKNAEELGSILRIKEDIDTELLFEFITDVSYSSQISFETIGIEDTKRELMNIVKITSVLIDKYDVVVTNPPYLNKFDKNLKDYLNFNYKKYSRDLFSVFIYRNLQLCKDSGYSAYMVPNVWMFINAYEDLRKHIIENKKIDSLIQMAKGAFFKEATVDVMSLVIKNSFEKSKGDYIRLESFKGDMEFQGLKFKEIINNKDSNYIYKIKQAKFVDIPGMPIAYWISNTLLDVFKRKKVYDLSISSGQNVTSNNNRFVRHFWELDQKNIGVNKKWLPYAKGGGFRKWYGNIIDVVDWSAEAREFYKKNSASRIISEEYWYRKAITWGLITSSVPSFRVLPSDTTFDKGGSSIFIKEESHFNYLLAVFNSNIFPKLAEIMNPTLNFQVKDVRDIPIIFENNEKITKMVDETIELSKNDWNSYEHSYKFKKNPLIKILNEKKKKHDMNHITIEDCYEEYKKETNNNFYRLKELEEQINKLLIDAYNLNDEIKHWVSEKDVTVTKVVDEKNIKDKLNSFCMDKREVVESFISYIVGCLLGRYNSNLDINKNKEIVYNNDKGIDIEDGKLDVLIMSDAGYPNETLINQFVLFIQEKFGEKYLESNLNFIAESLNKQGTTSREVIENYFLNDFYNDHVKYFKKRPIYWQYDSGKQNGFKALVYMHHYDEDTTGKVRVEYLHQVQRAYERTIANLQEDIAHSSDAKEITQLQKRIEKLTKQLKECREYDERLGHMALERVAIDLDDGVKVNYEKVQTDSKGKFHQILAKI